MAKIIEFEKARRPAETTRVGPTRNGGVILFFFPVRSKDACHERVPDADPLAGSSDGNDAA